MDIFINKKTWNSFNENELNEYIELVFQYYRKNGFPYYNLSNADISKELLKLNKFNTDTLLKDDVLKQVMLGLNLANHYMPHIYQTKCHGFRTPFENFIDDDLLYKTIKKRISLGDNMSDSGIRKTLSFISGSHKVSNFRPTIAKWIYDNYSNNGNVLDYSAGYGGRLLGAISSDKVIHYTAAEPCLLTYNGLLEMSGLTNKNIEIYNKPFEDISFTSKFDLSFSSPPYFNTEEYSYDDTQSFIRYPTKEIWRKEFLETIIEKNYNLIENNGTFIINIANVKTYKDLENDTLEICKKIGFKLKNTYKMTLSSLMKSGFKYEPIFVFKK